MRWVHPSVELLWTAGARLFCCFEIEMTLPLIPPQATHAHSQKHVVEENIKMPGGQAGAGS
jgi:hypothetical protein